MTLSEKLVNDMKEALKSKDERKLCAIRFLRSQIKNLEIDKRRPVTDEEVVTLIQKNIKQRKEVFPDYERMGRTDYLEKEKAEIVIMEAYLPPQLSKEEITKLVEDAIKETGAASIKDIGKVMGALVSRTKGKADGKIVSDLVKERLG